MPAKKPAATSQKAMDIHTPATAPAAPTSKPVIVPTRPMVAADPMLSSAASAEPEAGGVPATAPVVSRHTKTITPIINSGEAKTPVPKEAIKSQPIEESVTVHTKPELEPISHVSGSEQPVANGIPAPEADVLTATTNQAFEAKDIPVGAAVSSAVVAAHDDDEDENVDALVPVTGTAVQEKTAEQMRAEQLEQFIAKGTYAVPLNRTRRRRSAALLALLFVVLITIVTLDLLLDMQVITLSGIPHTDLLAP